MALERMDRIPAVASAMTPFPYSIDVGQSLAAARGMMSEHGFHHLAVKDGGRLIGVVSTRDISLVVSSAPDESAAEKRSLRDACGFNAYTVPLSAPLDTVLAEMAERKLEAVLVVKGERLAGIFTVTDACRQFADLLRALFPPRGEGDAA